MNLQKDPLVPLHHLWVVLDQMVEKEEKAANIMKEEATAMATDCQKDLDEALPALNNAMNALNSLSKGDLVEVKAMKSPPPGEFGKPRGNKFRKAFRKHSRRR